MPINNNITSGYESQVRKILTKVRTKKYFNVAVVNWLRSIEDFGKANVVNECANHIGITNINDIAHIVKADFCRQRICSVCAWRRQSKFVAQMFPVLENLGNKYDFIFATLTMRNIPLKELNTAINVMLAGYDKLLKRRKIKRAWVGKVRGLEITYNADTQTFHPHIHIFVAVPVSYFTDSDLYVSQKELTEYWQECIDSDYVPICDVRRVTEEKGGAVETLKYSFKATKDTTALEAFYYILKGRRLVSFSGVFAEARKKLRLSDFENILTDDIPDNSPKRFTYTLYKFDVTGGVYNYFKDYEMQI